MRRWFLALLALLVTAQLSWAGAALCCVDELASQNAAVLSGDAPHSASTTDAHPVCDTAGHCHCHHTGCATPLAEAAHLTGSQQPAPAPAQVLRPKSHIPPGLERPNWLRA